MENYDAIDKALEVKAEITERIKPKKKVVQVSGDAPQQDYEYSRAQLYNLVEKGQEAVNGILVYVKTHSIQEHTKLQVN